MCPVSSLFPYTFDTKRITRRRTLFRLAPPRAVFTVSFIRCYRTAFRVLTYHVPPKGLTCVARPFVYRHNYGRCPIPSKVRTYRSVTCTRYYYSVRINRPSCAFYYRFSRSCTSFIGSSVRRRAGVHFFFIVSGIRPRTDCCACVCVYLFKISYRSVMSARVLFRTRFANVIVNDRRWRPLMLVMIRSVGIQKARVQRNFSRER